MKHKILPLILSVVLILTLTACDNAKTVDSKTNELPAASGTDEQVISIFLRIFRWFVSFSFILYVEPNLI